MILPSDEMLRAVVHTEQQWRDGAAAIDRQLKRIEAYEETVRALSLLVDELAVALLTIADRGRG